MKMAMSIFGCCFGFSDDDNMENSKNQPQGFLANLFSKIRGLFRAPQVQKTTDTEEEEAIPKSLDSDFDPEYDNACPTCFEEYTSENPKVITECNHHYHLGCIFEWMERSPLCPFCFREMKFEELK